jgi:hypothetical protein
LLKKSLKGQAALEFLTTYGWAFLVILIMIGTLAYFGILSPGNILPNRCTFGSEFQCLDYQLSTDSVRIRLKSSVSEAIDVSAITFSSEAVGAFTCATPPTLPTSWKSGDVKELLWSGCSGGGLVQGQKGKIGMTFRYNAVASGSNYAKDVKGEIYSSVI